MSKLQAQKLLAPPAPSQRPGGSRIWMPGDELSEPISKGRQNHESANILGRRAFLGGALSICSAFGLSSCVGNTSPTPNRPLWLPGYSLAPNGSLLNADPVYVGFQTKGQLGKIGLNFFYDSIGSIPQDVIDRETRLSRVLCGFLSTIFDFSAPGSQTMLENFVMMFMTDKSFWPNGEFGHNIGQDAGAQIADDQGSVRSDCSPSGVDTPCVVRDILTLNNKGDFIPSTDSYQGLSADELAFLLDSPNPMSTALSEEMLHARQRNAISDSEHADFVSTISMVWDSGSTGQADDQKLADAWKNGDIRDALSEDGLKDYSMRSAVQQGLMYYYNTGSPPYYDPLMEIAVVSLLQLLGSYSDSFLGFAGASYLDKYAQEDPGKSYNTYRSSFMDREMYAQLGSFEHNVIRAFPGFFRKYYEPFGRPAHLDTRFNDGFQNPDIGKNPYLTNATDMKFLAQTIIPRALNPV